MKLNNLIFDNFPILETKRLKLTEITQDDVDDIFEMRSDADLMEFMDTDLHKKKQSSKNFIDYIQTSFSDKTGLNWAMIDKDSNEFIGYVALWRIIPRNFRAEAAVAIKPKYWDNGFAAEAMEKIIDFGFNMLNLHSIEANVNPNNKAVIKLLEKSGFIKEAHYRENMYFNGKFIDTLIYSILNDKQESQI